MFFISIVSTSRLPSLSCTPTEYIPFSLASKLLPAIAVPLAKTSFALFAPLSHLASLIDVLEETVTVTFPRVFVSFKGLCISVMLIKVPPACVCCFALHPLALVERLVDGL